MDWKRMPRLFAYPAFFVALLNNPALLADPIGTWQGAKADAYASGQQSSQQGQVAAANAVGATPVYFTSALADYRPDAFNVEARSSAHAEALGTRDALLSARVSANIGNPGTRPMGYRSDVFPGATAEASWTGDRIRIQPDVNGTMPDHVRLGVTLNLANVWRSDDNPHGLGGDVDLQVGGKLIQLHDHNYLYGSDRPDISSWLLQQGFDSVETIFHPEYPGPIYAPDRYNARTFLDLAIDENGWSDPFDLNLKSKILLPLVGNEAGSLYQTDFTLSLDDLTLADGTSIVDAGYSATFESGLAWPQPVPEPTAIAGWIALAGTAGWFSRKRARRTGAAGR